jgi:hypothetical protein
MTICPGCGADVPLLIHAAHVDDGVVVKSKLCPDCDMRRFLDMIANRRAALWRGIAVGLTIAVLTIGFAVLAVHVARAETPETHATEQAPTPEPKPSGVPTQVPDDLKADIDENGVEVPPQEGTAPPPPPRPHYRRAYPWPRYGDRYGPKTPPPAAFPPDGLARGGFVFVTPNFYLYVGP